MVGQYYPDRIDEFDAAFECLKTDPNYRTTPVASVLTETRLKDIKRFIADLPVESLEKQELLSFGRTVLHDQPLFNVLQQELTSLVSELAGEALEPAYNFLSLYNNLGVCEMHMDAPNAKWTLDICIEQSAPWPIYLAEPEPWPQPKNYPPDWAQQLKQTKPFHEHVLMPNNAVLFSGSSQWHYRNRIAQQQKANFCHLLFLHYFPVGAGQLLNPSKWASLFSMPELEQIKYGSSGASYTFEFS